MTICNAWMGRSQSFCVWQQERHAFYVLVLLLSYLHVFHPETPPQHECVESGDRFVNCERVARGFVSEVADRFYRVNQMAVAEPSFWLSYVFYSFRYYHITLLPFQSVPTPQRFRLRGRIRRMKNLPYLRHFPRSYQGRQYCSSTRPQYSRKAQSTVVSYL